MTWTVLCCTAFALGMSYYAFQNWKLKQRRRKELVRLLRDRSTANYAMIKLLRGDNDKK